MLGVTDFMAFGDSLTEGEWHPGLPQLQTYDPTKSYPTWLFLSLQARYTAQSFVMNNEGEGGQSASQDAEERFEPALQDRKPQVVLLLQGVNDFFPVEARTPATIPIVVEALRDDIEHARMRNAYVFLSTLTAQRDPNPDWTGDNRHWMSDALLRQTNAAIKTMAAGEPGVTVVEGYEITAADPGRYVGADGLHLSIEGYQTLAAAFFEAIKAKYEIPAPIPQWGKGPSIASLSSPRYRPAGDTLPTAPSSVQRPFILTTNAPYGFPSIWPSTRNPRSDPLNTTP